MSKVGLPLPRNPEEWKEAWKVLSGVWASKWNDRAFISCKKAGIDHSALTMSVLVQVLLSHLKLVLAFSIDMKLGE